MARSNKPLLWLPFAGGGLVAALIIPVLILITGVLMPLGLLPLPYEKMAAFAHNPLGKLILFGAVALPAWHAAHRLRMTAHDLGFGRRRARSRRSAMGRRGVLIWRLRWRCWRSERPLALAADARGLHPACGVHPPAQ